MAYVHTGALASLWALVLFAGVLAACERTGRLFLKRTGIGVALTDAESLVFSAGIGLTALSLAALALGLAGFLSAPSAWTLVLAMLFIPSFLLREESLPALSVESKIAAGLGALMLLLSLAPALAPPTGNDALAYHLAHPKAFLEAGRVAALPFTRESLWPFQTEMLFMLGLLLQGTSLAQLFHWVFLPLTAAAVYAYTARLYNKRAARVACAVWLFTPVVIAQSSQAYTDLALAFYLFTAFHAFSLKSAIGEKSAAVLSGILSGAAMGTKYLALAPVAALAAFWFFRPIFLLCMASVASVWYLRSWLAFGNPFYPFLSKWFGGRGFESTVEGFAPMGAGALSFLAHPWNITMSPHVFGGELIGPVYLMFLPLLAFYLLKERDRELRKMSLFAALCYGALFFQSQHTRYLVLALPFLCAGIGVVITRFIPVRGLLRETVTVALVAVCLLHLSIAAYRTRNVWPVIAGTVPAPEYLARRERSFEGYRYLSEHVKPADKVFNGGEVRRFYDTRPANTVYWTEPLRLDLEKRGLDERAFIQTERFSWVWTRHDGPPGMDGFLEQSGYRQVFSYVFHEGKTAFGNRIWRLQS